MYSLFFVSHKIVPNPPKSYSESVKILVKNGKVYSMDEIRQILFGSMLTDGNLSKRQYTPLGMVLMLTLDLVNLLLMRRRRESKIFLIIFYSI